MLRGPSAVELCRTAGTNGARCRPLSGEFGAEVGKYFYTPPPGRVAS